MRARTLNTYYIAILLLLFLTGKAFSQEIHTTKISDKVLNLVKSIKSLKDAKPSCTTFDECSAFEVEDEIFLNEDYKYHTKSYFLDVSKDDVINTLTSLHPKEIWSGDSQFQMAYNPEDESISYTDTKRGGVKIGEILFLELKIRLKKLKMLKIPVGFKIINLNREKGILEFSYLRNNKSKGVQQLIVEENGDKVKLTHSTRFLSGNHFRDNKLYGNFHEVLMDEFYDRLELTILNNKAIIDTKVE
jgi:hypothetical protein